MNIFNEIVNAIEDDAVEEAISLLDQIEEIEEPVTNDGRSLIHWAAWHSPRLLCEILKKSKNPNLLSKDGDTCLHLACETDVTFLSDSEVADVIGLLLKSGSNINILDRRGKTPYEILTSQQIKNHKAISVFKKNKKEVTTDQTGNRIY